MKSLDEIAAELQGYDPQALPAAFVNAFLAQLVAPVAGTMEVVRRWHRRNMVQHKDELDRLLHIARHDDLHG